jgi:hypothetical protein
MEPHQLASLVIGAVFTSVLLAMVALAFLKRGEYLPFRMKQTNLLMLTMIFGIFWWVGNLVALDIVRIPESNSSCFFLLYMAPNVLGINSYLSVLAYRMLRLYYIAVKMTKFDRKIYGFLLFQFFPVLAGVVWAIIARQDVIIADTETTCLYSSRIFLAYIYLTVFWQILFLFVMNYKCSKIIRSVNEYREIRLVLIIDGILIILTMPFIFMNWLATPWGIIIVNIIHLLGSSLLVLVCLIQPVYG